MRWVHEYGNLIYQIWKEKNKNVQLFWELDKTYIKVKGKCCYLYRSIDKNGCTLDIQLRKKRDHQAIYDFMKKLVRTILTTGKAPVLLCAFNKSKEQGFYLNTTHCTIRHLNSLIKQNHRHVKSSFSKIAGFQNLRHVSRTLKSTEVIYALNNRNLSRGSNFGFSTEDSC